MVKLVNCPSISPALMLFNVDILGAFRYIGERMWMLDKIDVLVNYNYQEIFYDLVWNYAQTDFIDRMKNDVDVSLPEKELVEEIMKTPYRDYYMYYLYRSKLENVPIEEWVNGDQDLTLWRNPSMPPRYVYDITRNYEVIVLVDPPYYRPMFNQFNMYYNQAPNCVIGEDLVNRAVYSLMPEGKMVVLNTERNDYNVYMNENLEYVDYPHILQKKKSNKKKRKLVDKVGYL